MEFLSVYNYRLPYRRGRKNANADFVSRVPLPPTVEVILGSSALTDPDDLGFYWIRVSGYIMLFFPILGVGQGGLVPSPNSITGTGLNGFLSCSTIGEGGDTLILSPRRSPKQPLPGIGLHDPLHGRQSCPESNSFHQGAGQICPR